MMKYAAGFLILEQIVVEEWRPVFGYEGWYSVSSLGRIRADSRGARRVQGKILRGSSCCGRYRTVRLCRDGVKTQTVHRLVAEAFIGPSNGLHINHKNNVGTDNRVENLEWCTRSQNLRHAADLGRCGKLDKIQVKEIRRRWEAGETQKAIAASFGITRGNVGMIVRGRTWRLA